MAHNVATIIPAGPVLTAAEMREVDRRTIELGIPDAVLMENAGHRVVEFLASRFAPMERQRIVVLCGKGNNGGDGLVVARQLFTRFRPEGLDVVLAGGEAPANLSMLTACGFPKERIACDIGLRTRAATIVIDALLGTGLGGAPREPIAGLIREVNGGGFPGAQIVAVDIPSGMNSDSAVTPWEHVRAGFTVTFTAAKVGMVLEPNASACGELVVGHIGSPASILPGHTRVAGPADFAGLLAPRPPMSHKGTFGHVLAVGGAAGKSGAIAMTGLAALRAGAGLVTVASEARSTLDIVTAQTPELMTEWMEGAGDGPLEKLMAGKRVLAIGPGLGVSPERVALLRRILAASPSIPAVVDADGLNNLAAESDIPWRANLVLTPHPGEMARLTGTAVAPPVETRIAVAREFAVKHGVTLVLKGRNTLTAAADGTVWINPTGGPALAKGGSGDILTGLIAGLMAQSPDTAREQAVIAAVWLHGRAGDLAARDLGERCVIASDLLRYLPTAMRDATQPA